MNSTPEIIKAAEARLRDAYTRYSTTGLRWDYCCNIQESSRQTIREELARRNISMATFNAMGRGEREVFIERQAAQIEAFRSVYVDPEVDRLRKEMAEQAAQIAVMQAALAEIIEQSKREPDWHVAKLRSIASVALSYDIERGKELLGALQASRYNADVATQAMEEMKRQAVEIEELRNLLAATVSTVSRRTDAMIEAHNAIPVEDDDETRAAMKEKP